MRTSLIFVGPASTSLLLATAPQFSLASAPLSHTVLEPMRLSCSATPQNLRATWNSSSTFLVLSDSVVGA